MEIEHINSMELCRRTGATYRQLDYWCRGELLKPVNCAPMPGSGHRREFDAEIVPAVSLLVQVSHIFHNKIRLDTLRTILENYEAGCADFEGLTLTWEEPEKDFYILMDGAGNEVGRLEGR